MAHVQFTDEIVKEYLLFRGFSVTLKAFDNELKIEKEKGFRVDRVVENLLQCVYNYDLAGLRDAWNHLETKIFTKLDHHLSVATRKLEGALLKFYLVHAIENSKSDKVSDFFSKMTQDLSGQSDWKDWFSEYFTTSSFCRADALLCIPTQCPRVRLMTSILHLPTSYEKVCNVSGQFVMGKVWCRHVDLLNGSLKRLVHLITGCIGLWTWAIILCLVPVMHNE